LAKKGRRPPQASPAGRRTPSNSPLTFPSESHRCQPKGGVGSPLTSPTLDHDKPSTASQAPTGRPDTSPGQRPGDKLFAEDKPCRGDPRTTSPPATPHLALQLAAHRRCQLLTSSSPAPIAAPNSPPSPIPKGQSPIARHEALAAIPRQKNGRAHHGRCTRPKMRGSQSLRKVNQRG